MNTRYQSYWNRWIGGRAQLYFATPAGAAATSGGGSGATGGGGAPPAPAAPAPGGGGGTGTPTGDGGGQPAGAGGQPGGEGLPQLRSAYDSLKSKYEPWEKWGVDFQQAQTFQQGYQAVFNEINEAVQVLGEMTGRMYGEDEIQEAIQAHGLVATFDWLRDKVVQTQQQMDEGGGAPDPRQLQDVVQQHVNRALGPIQQRENLRMTNEANAVFERTVHGLISEAFKKDGFDIGAVSQDEITLLTDATSEMMKYDPQALVALKMEGKTAPIQKYFAQARTILDKYYMARATRERSRAGGGPPGGGRPPAGVPPEGNGQRPSLDEMINNPNSIRRFQNKPDYNS